MPRPEGLEDIDPDELNTDVTVATFHMDEIGTNPDLLIAVGNFLKLMEKSGVPFEKRYNQVDVKRPKNHAEMLEVLKNHQHRWDERQGYYETWAAGGELRHEFQLTYAKEHAQKEGLPLFPWDHGGNNQPEPIDPDAPSDQDIVDKINNLELAEPATPGGAAERALKG